MKPEIKQLWSDILISVVIAASTMIAAITILLSGCASLKSSVKAASKTEQKTDNSVTKDSLSSIISNLQFEKSLFERMNEQRNIHTKTLEDKIAVLLSGGERLDTVYLQDPAKPISSVIKRGRIKAIATYTPMTKRLIMKLDVADTVIYGSHTETDNLDLSHRESERRMDSISKENTDLKNAVQSYSRMRSDSKSDKSIIASFSTKIGISNWFPVIIALISGLVIGKFLFKTKK